ncbi:hypothetical protein P389DRAFT_190789 [Cystobasidium minutum MCA 4210]|uniref:uncharacterized protein n=1 Tax=Cystobasidium minutum MCA 4210 TaxID=1397322 RepID=UPI0034CE3CF0|eukprot:jgi/Rhomi1/190789/estExt_fgenesh1_pg.C_60076
MPPWALYQYRVDGEGEVITERLSRPIPLPACKEMQVRFFEAVGKHLQGNDLFNLSRSFGLVSYAAVYGNPRNLSRILQLHALYDNESLELGEEGVLKMTRQAIDSLAAQDPPVKGKEPLKKWRKANPPRVELPGKLWEHCRECWIVSGKITFAKGKASRWGTIAEGRKCCSYHYWMRYGDHTAKGKKAKAKAEGKAKAKGKGKGRAAEASEEDSEESDGDEEEQDKSQDQAFDDMEAGEESGSPDALEGGPKLEPLDPNESFTFLNPAQAALIAKLNEGVEQKWEKTTLKQECTEAFNIAAAELTESAYKLSKDAS